MAGVGRSRSLPKKSADSHTGPTTSNVEFFVSGGGGETSSMCCKIISNYKLHNNKDDNNLKVVVGTVKRETALFFIFERTALYLLINEKY